jgi:hypothetical protein
MVELSQRGHANLSSRECAKLIGALLGGLVQQCDNVETVRDAIRWWAETTSAWEVLEQFANMSERLPNTDFSVVVPHA